MCPCTRTRNATSRNCCNLREHGVSERQPLDLHSPYGCSKGVADQYMLDFARCYRLPTVVFRMSCIYGPHQCGTEDQGWVAHFVRSALRGEPITLYGDGCQVRDILYVDDLVRAMTGALQAIEKTRGRAFNVGGGPANAVSLLNVIDHLTAIHGQTPELHLADWRQGDQRYYVSDTRSLKSAIGWTAESQCSGRPGAALSLDGREHEPVLRAEPMTLSKD